jgi:hypothetical protein
MFSAPGLVFGGTESVGFRFHVLWVRNRFRRYQGRRVPLTSFALPDSFSTVPRASGPVFMFCALDWISTVPRASGPIFMSCAPALHFGGNERVGSHFHVLRSRTHFRRYRGRLVSFSCFAGPESFSAVARASGPVFMFCVPGIVFDGTVGVRSRFHVLQVRNHFRRYRGRRVPLSCFAIPDSFSAVPSASGPVFGGNERVRSRFHVLRFQTRFRRYQGRRVLFSCIARPDSFSAV